MIQQDVIQRSDERIQSYMETIESVVLKDILLSQVYNLPHSELVKYAIDLMETYHKDELRGDNVTPYPTHLFRVCLIFMEAAFQADILGFLSWTIRRTDTAQWLTIALLHDILEDTDITPYELENFFDSFVIQKIKALSKNYYDFEGKDNNYYFVSLQKEHPLVKTIKIVDRIDNLYSYKRESIKEKREKYIKETEKYIVPLANSYLINDVFIEDNLILSRKLGAAIDALRDFL